MNAFSLVCLCACEVSRDVLRRGSLHVYFLALLDVTVFMFVCVCVKDCIEACVYLCVCTEWRIAVGRRQNT